MFPDQAQAHGDPRQQAKAKAKAMGVWTAGGSVASTAGPLFGGLLTPVHWSLMFAINIPFCIIALALATRIPDSQRHGRPIDWPGQLLILALLWSIRLDRRS